MINIAVSPLTGIIYAGRSKEGKDGISTWTSKEDVTSKAVGAVFEWFLINAEETESGIFQVSYPTVEGYEKMTLTFDMNKNQSKDIKE